MQAYRDTIDYMYSDNPQVFKDYAEFAGVTEAMAQARARRVLPEVAGSARTRSRASTVLMADAVELKFISAPLTKEQTAELVKLQKPIAKR